MAFLKNNKFGIVLVLAAAVIGIFLFWSGVRQGKDPNPDAQASHPPAGSSQQTKKPGGFAMPVEVSPVTVGRITEDVRAVGTLQANESVIIRPEIQGRLSKINFEEGQHVRKGTILVELDAAELQAQLAQARAELEIARLNYSRMRRLIANDNVSRQELDQASTTLKSAQANYALFTERVSKTQIRAPFSGVLGTRLVSPGDYLQAGRDIVNLEDLSTLKIEFRVPEKLLSRLAVKQEVEIEVDAFDGRMFRGQVYALDPRVDQTSRSIRVRAKIPNPQLTLRPGMFANVTLVTGYTEDALLIPEEAIVPQEGKVFVFLVKNNVAQLTEIQLGLRQRAVVQVLEGLAPGDLVVRGGHQKVRHGMPVMVVEG